MVGEWNPPEPAPRIATPHSGAPALAVDSLTVLDDKGRAILSNVSLAIHPGEVIGVAQALNKKKGRFTQRDMGFMEAMTTQAAVALQSTQLVENVKRERAREMQFLDVVSDVTSEIDLSTLLQKVMSEATRMLKAERSTLFINDEKTNELFSRVAQGDAGIGEIRLPNHLGIAGAVFTSAKSVNIPHAYADLRFNPSFDKRTGYFTRSMLAVPVINKDGKLLMASVLMAALLLALSQVVATSTMKVI